jgi:hypothetical protein
MPWNVPVPLFEHEPERCPRGHELGPGRVHISWSPCVCQPAREAAERGRGLGHLRLECLTCDDEGHRSVYFEPPHDPAQPQARLVPADGPSAPGSPLAAGIT